MKPWCMSAALLRCGPPTWLHARIKFSPFFNPDRSRAKRPHDPAMDPFGLAAGIVGLVGVALKLVVGTLGMIDKTVAAYDEAADELKGLQQDLKRLQKQMIRIHRMLKVLASNTKDRGFKKLLQE